MDFMDWLTSWLTKHPLKTPDVHKQIYTDEVMARVRAEAQPKKAVFSLPVFIPRLALVAASVAVIAFAVVTRQPSGVLGRMARVPSAVSEKQVAELEENWQLLAMLDDSTDEPLTAAAEDVEGFLQDSDEMELLMLAADTGSGDEQWLEQTLSLLEQFDDEAGSDLTGEEGNPSSEEEWVHELEMLDEVDLTAKL